MSVASDASLARVLSASCLWGIHLCLAVYACIILCKRKLKYSRAARWQFALVLVVLALSTAHLAILFRKENTSEPVFRISLAWASISTVIYVISDCIVVWRAWVLWPKNWLVKGVLAFVIAITLGCAAPSLYVQLGNNAAGTMWFMALIGFVPFMLSNLVATCLITYKAWLYRTEVEVFLNTDSSDSGSRLSRVFLLLIESGTIYILLWIIYLAAFLGCEYRIVDGKIYPVVDTITFKFFDIWEVMMVEVSAMYPIVVIILVSNYMSQNDIVNSIRSSERPGTVLHRDRQRGGIIQQTDGQDVVSHVRFARRSVDSLFGSISRDQNSSLVTTLRDQDKQTHSEEKREEDNGSVTLMV